MIKFFHHLFNPHCADCRDKEEYNKICNSCETLKNQLEKANYDNKRLLDQIILLTNPKTEIVTAQPEETAPIFSMGKTWNIRKAELERESRNTAELERRKKLEEAQLKTATQIKKTDENRITELEKELEIENAAN
jgi:hypothetical protein